MATSAITWDTSRLETAFAVLLQYSLRSVEQEFRAVVKGIVQYAINITPPASGKGKKEKESVYSERAKAAGMNRIAKDLHNVFVPVQIKGTRTIKQVFGKPLQQPVVIPTRELYPNVDIVYHARSQRRHDKHMTRGRKQAYYVDAAKLETLKRKLQSRVGHAMSGFALAASSVGARLPSFARGKGGAGSGVLDITPDRLHFRMENLVPYLGQVPEVPERLQAAIDYETNDLLRRIPHMAAAAAKRAGLRQAA